MSCSKVCHVVKTVLRYLLGLMCLFFGAMKFMPHKDMPEMPAGAESFMNALMEAGYFWPIMGIVFIAVGIALVSGFYVPLALVVLFPISLNIFLFNAMLNPSGIVIGLVLIGLNVILLYKYKKAYAPLLKPKFCCKGSCEVPQ